MQTIKFLVIFLLCSCVVLMSGCGSELADCRLAKNAQLKDIEKLQTDLATAGTRLGYCKRQLDSAETKCNTKQEGLRQEIARLEDELVSKRRLIAMMQEQLLRGVPIPVEVSTMLEDFAAKHEMVTYDASRGIVKFQSDLLFEVGSDKVAASAAEAVKTLCSILNSERAKEFDIIIAGHTDDIPIGKPETLKVHPSNWHLSAHRAISVLRLMAANKIEPKRMSARGFGEYHPVVPNEPNKRGHPQNRRVEIYIVAKGT